MLSVCLCCLSQGCWIPILQSLATAAVDGRVVVRTAAMEALTQAVLDRHLSAVPSGILIRILGEIVIPTLLHLGQELRHAAEVEAGVSASSAVSMTMTMAVSLSVSVPSVGGDKGATDMDEKVEMEVGVLKACFVEECFSCVCSAFLRQLNKLSRYPSFDKLWLQLLQLFGFYLRESFLDTNIDTMSNSNVEGVETKVEIEGGVGATGVSVSGTELGGLIAEAKMDSKSSSSPQVVKSPSTSRNQQGPIHSEWNLAVQFAREKLRNLIEMLVEVKVFEQRSGLWMVTVEEVGQLRGISDLFSKKE